MHPEVQLGVELVYGEVANEEDGIGQGVGLTLHLGHHPANQLVEPREPYATKAYQLVICVLGFRIYFFLNGQIRKNMQVRIQPHLKL